MTDGWVHMHGWKIFISFRGSSCHTRRVGRSCRPRLAVTASRAIKLFPKRRDTMMVAAKATGHRSIHWCGSKYVRVNVASCRLRTLSVWNERDGGLAGVKRALSIPPLPHFPVCQRPCSRRVDRDSHFNFNGKMSDWDVMSYLQRYT
jgi:hypothetical protein